MAEQTEAHKTVLDLGELVDLELQLRADRGEEPARLRCRDEAIGREICAPGVPTSRAYVLRRWLRALHPEPASTPGRKLAAAYRLASLLFIACGLGAGASAAGALLRYDGGAPVNVVSYLAVLVGSQVLLAVFAVIAMLPAEARRRVTALGPLHATLRELGVRRAGFDAALTKLGKRTGADAGAVRAWSAVYGESERWRLLAITQRAAVAFNIGALGASFYSVAVTALAFAWSTTLDLDPATVHRITTFIALPWLWIPDAVPSLELVRASHYFPGGQYDPALLGDWWPFLLASLLVYGLIPRTLLWLVAERRGRVLRASLELDHGDARLAYQRLTSGWAADPDRDAGVAGAIVSAERAGERPNIQGTCRAIVWADAAIAGPEVEALVQRRTGCSSVGLVSANAESNELGAAGSGGIAIIAEAWEAPTRALGRLLGRLRTLVDARTPIVVLLIGADPNSAAVWRSHLAGLGDPYLFVDDVAADDAESRAVKAGGA